MGIGGQGQGQQRADEMSPDHFKLKQLGLLDRNWKKGSENMFNTIRSRIMSMFFVSLVFVGLLALLGWGTVASVQSKLALSMHLDDLFNNILEIRRFEKNFLFYHDLESLQEGLFYLKQTSELVGSLAPDIVRVAGKESYEQFVDNLEQYHLLMSSYAGADPVVNIDQDQVRFLGKQLVDFTEEVLARKRERILAAFAYGGALPLASLAVFLVLMVVVYRLVSRKMLVPLVEIRKTTERVAQGDFSPIEYECVGGDEICQLIHAFNSMAKELETNQEALVQSRKIAAIGTFTAGIAHELNNPLNNIYMTAETLYDDFSDQLDPEGKELLLDILNQDERAAEIVKNLLDFSRTEKPTFVTLELATVIRTTLKLVKNQIMLSGIQLNLHVDPVLPLINGNLRNLEQVFLNLFLNAIQAMKAGGTITLKATFGADGFIRVDVSDTGSGIQPEDLERIFEPFYTTKAVGRGTGLGLAVSYALVKKHGGRIEVESEVGVGTTFSVYLPAKDRGEDAAAAQENSQKP